jgi:hypothetical protein
MRITDRLMIGLGLFLLALVYTILPGGNGYGFRLASGGLFNWYRGAQFVLFTLGVCAARSARGWPPSVAASLLLTTAPLGGASLGALFC